MSLMKSRRLIALPKLLRRSVSSPDAISACDTARIPGQAVMYRGQPRLKPVDRVKSWKCLVRCERANDSVTEIRCPRGISPGRHVGGVPEPLKHPPGRHWRRP